MVDFGGSFSAKELRHSEIFRPKNGTVPLSPIAARLHTLIMMTFFYLLFVPFNTLPRFITLIPSHLSAALYLGQQIVGAFITEALASRQ